MGKIYVYDKMVMKKGDSRSHTEYLLPRDCIIVLDSYFNFAKKSNLVGNL